MSGKGHGGPARGSGNTVNNRRNKQQHREAAISIHGAAILLPDALGLDHARRVVCASARNVADARLLLDALGLLP